MYEALADGIVKPRPLYVALCGAPRAGKTVIANHLAQRYGGLVVDDGRPLRDACKALYGLSEHDVTTHAGKDRWLLVCGRLYTVRQLLGDLGRSLEARYGEFFIPELAVRSSWEHPEYEKAPFFVFPSVRMKQAHYYKSLGETYVIEVTRDGYVPENDFDHYDRSICTHTIENPATEDWEDRIYDQLAAIFNQDVITPTE